MLNTRITITLRPWLRVRTTLPSLAWKICRRGSDRTMVFATGEQRRVMGGWRYDLIDIYQHHQTTHQWGLPSVE